MPRQPTGLGWLPDGRLLITSMLDRRLMRREHDGTLVVHADLAGHTGGHLNDFVVDATGRAYIGNFGFDLVTGGPLRPASLHRVDPDGTVTEVADDLWFPNGAAITPAGELLVVETFGNRVSAFTLNEDGALSNRRTWAEFGPLPTARYLHEAMPQLAVAGDGCSLDREGALWLADIRNERLLRVLDGGQVTDEIRPEVCPFACALGGADGATLFVCAAPDFDEADRSSTNLARILATRVPVPAR